MRERIFIKVGGSFFTDKTKSGSLKPDRIRAVATSIAAALQQKDFEIVMGHGAGAYGHIPAQKFNAQAGVHPTYRWEGFHRIRRDMALMNIQFVQLCREKGLSPIAVQPSAIITAHNGEIDSIHTAVIENLLVHQQIPIVHGDIVVDKSQGFTIVSTEEILNALAVTLHFHRVVMISDVPGVLDVNGNIIPEINAGNLDDVMHHLGGSAGVDVTGGMKSKVSQLVTSIRQGRFDKAIITTCLPENSSIFTELMTSNREMGTVISL